MAHGPVTMLKMAVAKAPGASSPHAADVPAFDALEFNGLIDMLGEASRGGDEGAPRVALNSLELPVIVASEEELAAHQAVLDGLDKAVKGTSVWRLQPVATADEQTA